MAQVAFTSHDTRDLHKSTVNLHLKNVKATSLYRHYVISYSSSEVILWWKSFFNNQEFTDRHLWVTLGNLRFILERDDAALPLNSIHDFSCFLGVQRDLFISSMYSKTRTTGTWSSCSVSWSPVCISSGCLCSGEKKIVEVWWNINIQTWRLVRAKCLLKHIVGFPLLTIQRRTCPQLMVFFSWGRAADGSLLNLVSLTRLFIISCLYKCFITILKDQSNTY